MKAIIEPINFWNETATTLSIENVNVQSFGENGSAHILWYLSTDEGKRLKNDVIYINNEEYAAWGSDDNYIITTTASKLGVTIISIEN